MIGLTFWRSARGLTPCSPLSLPLLCLYQSEFIMCPEGHHCHCFLRAVRANLRDYQREGVSWLVSLSQRKLNGILADEVTGRSCASRDTITDD